MSVYLGNKASSSSSSSSSTSCSTSSLGSTGCFSETSFSSLSTIIAPQAGVKPFGDPDYNYFWIQNQSKTNPKASYYYNYKSHSVVWSRPLPKTVPLPLYSTAWVPQPKNISEGEEEVIVSDPEDAFQKQRRLQIKQRNRRLASENRSGTIYVLSVDNAVKSKKKLDVLWKLYRLPGESVEDVKNRLLMPIESEVQIKTEVLSNEDENSNTEDISVINIKEEPNTYDDYSLEVQEASQSINELENHSDSDPDNVDFLIQQDYNVANSYDSELEHDSYNENDSCDSSQKEESSDNEKEESSWDSNDESMDELEKWRQEVKNSFNKQSLRELQNDTIIEPIIENCNSEEPEVINDFVNNFLLSDMLEIEIDENEKENMFVEFNNTAENDKWEEVNWNFEKSSESVINSLLTREALNPMFKVSKSRPFQSKQKNKILTKRTLVETRRVPKLIIKKEPYYHIKQESDTAISKPLVYDMYGTRTTNYDYFPQSKESPLQNDIVASDSSNEESVIETIAQRIKNVPRRASQNDEKKMNGNQDALELKNWFPKSELDSRKRKKSDDEWLVPSDLSSNSDLDESDIKVLRRKRKKIRSSIDEQECQPASTTSGNSKQQQQALTLAMDLSTAKVESYSLQKDLIEFTQEGGFTMKTQEKEKKDVVQNEKPKEEENDATTDSESDSSSCCSRPSCSCSSSSSSSSSSDDENDKQAK
ncbi:uncharacterized protein LOC131668478 [Phymastichus coffea]|uniref:uncharacterized protein LOC131668478 n=1 Tax=Phymastichus coffea TaxID=108790 RepID=UPI00273C68D2|nr:uncharacterized protein LOC131668478 [Phymastichus coffea]